MQTVEDFSVYEEASIYPARLDDTLDLSSISLDLRMMRDDAA